MRRYENWAHKISSWKISEYNYLKTCPASFSLSTECIISALHPELFSEGIKGQKSAAAHDLILMEVHGKSQFVVDKGINSSKVIIEFWDSNILSG